MSREEVSEFFDAIRHKDVNRVRTVLDKGMSPSRCDSRGEPAVVMAVRYNATEIITLLLERGANVRVPTQYYHGRTVLHFAAARGDLLLTKQLLDHGAPVHATTRMSETPLFSAVIANQVDVARLLFEYGAIMQLGKCLGVTSYNGNLGMAKLLLEQGANPNHNRDVVEGSPLFNAIHQAKPLVVDELLRHGAIIDFISIMHNMEHFEENILRKLIQHGVDLHETLYDGQTCTHLATVGFTPEVLRILLEHGAPVDNPSYGGKTPLQLSHTIEHAEVLLEFGADMFSTYTDRTGNISTVLDILCRQHDSEMIAHLQTLAHARRIHQLLLGTTPSPITEATPLQRFVQHDIFDRNVLSIVNCFATGQNTGAFTQLQQEAST